MGTKGVCERVSELKLSLESDMSHMVKRSAPDGAKRRRCVKVSVLQHRNKKRLTKKGKYKQGKKLRNNV